VERAALPFRQKNQEHRQKDFSDMTKFTKSAAAAAAAILVSVTLAGCGGDEKTDITTVKVGVVGEYNAQWDTVNKLLEKDKIKVELVKYSDYATPNRALSDKEIDLNAFQHKAYLANDIKRNGYKIVAIGTTVMRTVETAVSTNGMIKPMEGWTNKFIFAPYEFTVADAMVTNFHLPYSTQLMMVAAFGGYETVMNAYKVAKEEGYRFGTYGDAMLIL